MLESLLNKVTGFQACNFIKKRLQHRCFRADEMDFKVKGHGTLKSIPGDHGWPTRKIFEF